MKNSMRLILLLLMLLPAGVSAQQTYTQTGVASFYADAFQGRTTASGERYDKNKLTCAHLSLPFGTVLRVTSLESNRSTVVRVNDRGPFAPGRIIDLSRRAAEALGIISAGKGRVRVEVVSSDALTETPGTTEAVPPAASTQPQPATQQPQPARVDAARPPAAPAPQAEGTPTDAFPAGAVETYRVQVAPLVAKGYAVQLASYQGLSNLLRRLGAIDVPNLFVNVVGAEPNANYKLMVGPFNTRAHADREKTRLEKQFPGCFVVQF